MGFAMVKGTERASLTIGRSFATDKASPEESSLGALRSSLPLLLFFRHSAGFRSRLGETKQGS
jgi:hypothetical protein